MIPEIPDNPAVVEPVFRQLKKNFYTGKTRPIAARKAALRNLIDGYIALKEEINEATEKDIGNNKFFNEFAIHPINIEEMEDLYANVEKWAQPESISTPLGKVYFIQLLEWEAAESSLSLLEWPLSFQPGTTQFIQLFLLLQQLLQLETA